MAEPLRFRVQMVGFAESSFFDHSSSGFVMDIEWLTNPPYVRRFSLSRAAFDAYGDALIAAMHAGDIYWLNLDGPVNSPLLALMQAVRDGQTDYP